MSLLWRQVIWQFRRTSMYGKFVQNVSMCLSGHAEQDPQIANLAISSCGHQCDISYPQVKFCQTRTSSDFHQIRSANHPILSNFFSKSASLKKISTFCKKRSRVRVNTKLKSNVALPGDGCPLDSFQAMKLRFFGQKKFPRVTVTPFWENAPRGALNDSPGDRNCPLSPGERLNFLSSKSSLLRIQLFTGWRLTVHCHPGAQLNFFKELKVG